MGCGEKDWGLNGDLIELYIHINFHTYINRLCIWYIVDEVSGAPYYTKYYKVGQHADPEPFTLLVKCTLFLVFSHSR